MLTILNVSLILVASLSQEKLYWDTRGYESADYASGPRVSLAGFDIVPVTVADYPRGMTDMRTGYVSITCNTSIFVFTCLMFPRVD